MLIDGLNEIVCMRSRYDSLFNYCLEFGEIIGDREHGIGENKTLGGVVGLARR